MATDVGRLAKELASVTDGLSRSAVIAWAVATDPHPRDFPLFGSDFYGSSVNFQYELRAFQRGLLVPERSAVLAMGAQPGWDPTREAPDPADDGQPPAPCSACGGAIGPPPRLDDDPTVFVCPKCYGSGFDPQLARQLELAGLPPKERPKKAARPQNRKARRAAQRAEKVTT